MWYLLLLIAGFVPLIYGANLLVDNASSLAKRLNIPPIVIGLTIFILGLTAVINPVIVQPVSNIDMLINILSSLLLLFLYLREKEENFTDGRVFCS